MPTLQPAPTSTQPFLPGALILTDLARAASGVSPYHPHAHAAAPTANLETALAAAKQLCTQHQGSMPIIYTANPIATGGQTSTAGLPLRPLQTDLRTPEGKPVFMCIVH